MTYSINSTQARSYSRANLNIFDEVNHIMRAIMEAADAGEYSIEVDDGTLMTESTPEITTTATVVNPTVTASNTIIINGNTVTLGTTGTNLNSVIADINDAQLPGVVASKTTTNKLVLTSTASQTNWTIIIGDGTANTELGLTAGTVYPMAAITSTEYYNSWQGVSADRKLDDEIAQVKAFFENIGYNITISKNAQTEKTFKWSVFW